jgi:(p)ppGpp synthase/HD superfamily hydrolase
MSPRFHEALTYAAELHAKQLRKASNIPYVAHLLGVTAIVLEHGAEEDEAIAALLHDAVEDQGGQATAAEIRRRFGDRVIDIVLGCTDADTIPKPPWRERKERYIAHLDNASPSILLVSAADKLHNASSIVVDYRRLGDEIWDRFNGGREGTLWYYRTLADKFNQFAKEQRMSNDLADELERTVRELEALAEAH